MATSDPNALFGGAATSFTYTFLDDDGAPLPPEAEASVLMAIGLTEEMNASIPPDGVDGEAAAGEGEEEQPLMAPLEPYSEDAAAFEAKRAVTLRWLMAAAAADNDGRASAGLSASAAVSESGSRKDVPQSIAGANKGKEDHLEYDADEFFDEAAVDDEDEEGGMGDWAFSREATAEDEPWELERILKRRVYRAPRQALLDDGEDSTAAKTKKSTSASPPLPPREKELQYLCQWRYYAEPTWEARALLEEEGYGPLCDAFDDGISAVQQAGGIQRGRGTVVDSGHGGARHGLDIDPHPAIESLFGRDLLAEIADALGADGITFLYYMSVAVPPRIKAFLATWRERAATHRPTLLFHGTNSKNIVSIVRNGLIVPGSHGVTVANGSVHGVGIYTAKCPMTSTGYCNDRSNSSCYYRRSGEMFACLGLVSNNDSVNVRVTAGGGYCVFFDASFVVPIGLIGWQRTGGAAPTRKRCQRRNFNTCFDPKAPVGVISEARAAPRHAAALAAQANAIAANIVGPSVSVIYRPMTKRMLKECPRKIKDLYRAGALISKASASKK